MPFWVDDNEVKKCQIRRNFQGLVWTLVIFHNTFCKPKNSLHFQAIANTMQFLLLECMNQENPPDELLLGNMLNNLKANITSIINLKSGNDKKDEFVKNHTETYSKYSNFHNAISLGHRHYTEKFLIESKIAEIDSPSTLEGSPATLTSPTAVSPMPADIERDEKKHEVSVPLLLSQAELLELIDGLKSVPYANLPKCSDKIIHLFAHHPREMLGGSLSATFGLGSALTTLIGWAQYYFSNKEIDFDIGMSDSRVYVPMVAGGVALLLYLRGVCKEFACSPNVIKYIDDDKNKTKVPEGSINGDEVNEAAVQNDVAEDRGTEEYEEPRYQLILTSPRRGK